MAKYTFENVTISWCNENGKYTAYLECGQCTNRIYKWPLPQNKDGAYILQVGDRAHRVYTAHRFECK